jgi:hypothetical protein
MNASSERDERNRGTSALEPAPMHPRQVAASRFCELAGGYCMRHRAADVVTHTASVGVYHRRSTGSLRHLAGYLVPALVILFLAAPSGATAASANSVAIAHGVVDSACAGGTGAVIPAPPSWLAGAASVATTILPSEITLVVVSSGYPPASFAEVHAFTRTCAPDSAFGDNGVDRLTFGGRDFSVAAAIPALGGGTILAGQSTSGWLVARIDASGRLDPAFGRGGWTVLPWPGGASAVAQSPSGDIVLGGSVGGGCCVREWVGELSAHGALVRRFGSGGRVRIGPLEDSGVARVAVEPGGDILALTEGGNMGCWGVTVAALNASGSPVPSCQRNFNATMQRALPSEAFVGDLAVRRDDFLLVGTEQENCVTNVLSPTATGRIIAFEPNGEIEASFASRGEARFSSSMEDPVWVLPQQDGGMLIVGMTPVIQAKARARLNLVDISTNGNVDRGYGHDGVDHLQLPFLSQSYPASAVPVSVTTNGHVSVVVSSTADGTALKLVQFLG